MIRSPCGEAAAHDPVRPARPQHGQLARLHDVLRVHHQRRRPPAAVIRDPLLGREDHVARDPLGKLHLHVHPGQQKVLRIGKLEPQRDNAGLLVDVRLGDGQQTLLIVCRAVRERQRHLRFRLGQTLVEEAPPPGEHLRRRPRHVHQDRIDVADDRQRLRLPRRHQRALRRQRPPDEPRQRRAQHGPVEIDLGRAEPRLRELQRRRRAVARARRRLEILLGGDLARDQLRQTVRLARRRAQLRLGLGHLRGRRRDLGLVGGRVDAVERVAHLHRVALAERALDDDAGHLRPDLRDARGQHAPRQRRRQRHVLRLQRHHGDRRRRPLRATGHLRGECGRKNQHQTKDGGAHRASCAAELAAAC